MLQGATLAALGTVLGYKEHRTAGRFCWCVESHACFCTTHSIPRSSSSLEPFPCIHAKLVPFIQIFRVFSPTFLHIRASQNSSLFKKELFFSNSGHLFLQSDLLLQYYQRSLPLSSILKAIHQPCLSTLLPTPPAHLQATLTVSWGGDFKSLSDSRFTR